VDVKLVVTEDAPGPQLQRALSVPEELGHDDWVIQDDLSVNVLVSLM
jgi:hypothetical protein